MINIWDWFDYELHTESSRVFMSSTMFKALGAALNSAADHSMNMKDTVERIEIFCTDSD